MSDLQGHTVTYLYTPWDPGHATPGSGLAPVGTVPVPTEIRYNGTVITFYYQDRPDPVESPTGTGIAELTKRLVAINIVSSPPGLAEAPTEVRAYGLSYETSPLTGQSTLASVTEYGSDAKVNPNTGVITGTTLPAQSFSDSATNSENGWSTKPIMTTGSATAYTDGPQPAELDTGLPAPAPTGTSYLNATGDVNGDHRTDIVLVDAANPYSYPAVSQSCVLEARTVIGNGDQAPPPGLTVGTPGISFIQLPAAPTSAIDAAKAANNSIWQQAPCGYVHQILLADVNGDGNDDLILIEGWGFPLGPEPWAYNEVDVYLSNGDGTFRQFSQGATDIDYPASSAGPGTGNLLATTCKAADITGDHQASVLCFFMLGADPTHSALDAEPQLVSLQPTAGKTSSPGDDSYVDFKEIYQNLSIPLGPHSNIDQAIMVGDVNGDGKADIVLAVESPQPGAYCEPSSNSCWGGTGVTELATFLANDQGPSGSTAFAAPAYANVPGPSLQTGDCWQLGNVQLAEVNGDGRADFIGYWSDLRGSEGSGQDPCINARGHSSAEDGIMTGISLGNGQWHFNENYVPGQPGYVPIVDLYANGPSFVDVDGSGRVGLMFVINQYPKEGGPICVFRVTGNGDGTFNWPSSFSDCPQQLTGVSSTDTVQIGTLNYGGEPITDLFALLAQGPDTKVLPVITAAPVSSPAHWSVASTNGQGQASLVSVETELVQSGIPAPAPVVFTISPAPSCAGQATCQTYQYREEPLASLFHRVNGTGISVWTAADAWHVADMTGDGQDALVYVDTSPGNGDAVDVDTYLNQGGTWSPFPVGTPLQSGGPLSGDNCAAPQHYIPLSDPARWIPMDLDGTGRTDLVHVDTCPSTGDLLVTTLVPTADGHWDEHVASFAGSAYLANDLNWRPVDVNGDRREDLVHIGAVTDSASSSGQSGSLETLLSTGDGSWQLVGAPLPDWLVDANQGDWVTADLNGGGSSELVDISDGSSGRTVTALFPNGDGTWSVPSHPQPITDADPALQVNNWQATNFGGGVQNLSDLYTDNSTGGSVDVELNALRYGSNGIFELTAQSFTDFGTSQTTWYSAPLQGSSEEDLYTIDFSPTSGQTPTLQLRVPPEANDTIDFVANGIGGTASVAYAPASFGQPEGPAANCEVPGPLASPLVHAITTSADERSAGSGSTTTYQFACPHWSSDYDALTNWGTETTVTEGDKTFAGLRTEQSSSWSDACGAQPTESENDTLAGAVLNSTTHDYADTVTSSGSTRCQLAEQTTADCEGEQAIACLTDTQTLTYDQYGNMLQVDEHESTGPSRRTVNSYTYATLDGQKPYIEDLLSATTLYDTTHSTDNPTLVSQTTYCYDDDCGAVAAHAKGLPTKITDVDLQGGISPTTSMRYDTYGNLVSETDPDGHTTRYQYDSAYHEFVVSSVDALNERTTSEWDLPLGLLMSETGPNELTTTYRYDTFGRQTSVSTPGAGTTTTSYQNFGQYGTGAQSSLQRVTTSVADGSRTGLWQTTWFDGLGRTVAVARKGSTSSAADVTTTTYSGASNLVSSESNWASTSEPLGPFAPVLPNSTPGTSFQYDSLGRPTTFTDPMGARTTVDRLNSGFVAANIGLGLLEVTTDPTGHLTFSVTDPWGRAVTQAVGLNRVGEVAITNTTYDVTDDPVSVANAQGVTTSYIYNSLGRLTSVQDPDRGSQSFRYDPDGNETSSVDARGQRTTYRYDALGRLVREDYPGEPSPMSWHYSQPGHGNATGELTSTADPSAHGCPGNISSSLEYDSNQRLVAVRTCVKGASETTKTSYNRYGKAVAEQLPDGEHLALAYNGADQLTSLGGYVTDATYDPSGAPLSLTLGNGDTETFTYNPDGQLTRGEIADGGVAIAGNSETYTPDEREASQSQAPGGTQAYTYGYQGQLTSDLITSSGGPTRENWNFDAAGQLQSSSVLGNVSYGNQGCASPVCPPPDAPTTIGATTLGYNRDGDLITSTGGPDADSIAWSGLDQPKAITSQQGTTKLQYASSGALVMQQFTPSRTGQDGSSSTVRYFGNGASTVNGRQVQDVYFGGELVAQRNGTSVKYLSTDQRGSPILVMSDKGALIGSATYTPYGELNQTTALPPFSPEFAGATPLLGTDLLQMGARLYSPKSETFLSPDPVPNSSAASPIQASNPYSYANYDPINSIDRSGADPEPDSTQSDNRDPETNSDPNDLSGGEPQGWYSSQSGNVQTVTFTEDTITAPSNNGSPPPGGAGTDGFVNTTGAAAAAVGTSGTVGAILGAMEPGLGGVASNGLSAEPAAKAAVATAGVAALGYGALNILAGLGVEGAGALLDATGIGAPLGIGLNVGGATLITAGAAQIAVGVAGVAVGAASANVLAMSSTGQGGGAGQPPSSKASSPIWRATQPYRGSIRTNGLSGSGRQYYQWDYTHGDIEVYNSRGVHIGSMDSQTGQMYKPPVPGRVLGL